MQCRLVIKYSVESSSTPCCAEVILGLPRPIGTELLYSTISLSTKYLFSERLGRLWGKATDDGFRERSYMIRRTSWSDVADEVDEVTGHIMTILGNAVEASARILRTQPPDSASIIYIPETPTEVPHD
jgi:hypothetical protein